MDCLPVVSSSVAAKVETSVLTSSVQKKTFNALHSDTLYAPCHTAAVAAAIPFTNSDLALPIHGRTPASGIPNSAGGQQLE